LTVIGDMTEERNEEVSHKKQFQAARNCDHKEHKVKNFFLFFKTFVTL